MGDMKNTPVDEIVEELTGCSDSDLDDGHRSLKAYLRATCNHSDAEAARLGRLTVAAAGLPGLAEALHTGRIDTPQSNELAVAHANPRIRERLVEFAPMLLELAERLSFREFRVCVQRFVVLADLDGAHRDLDDSIRNRRAHVVNLNGSLCLDAGFVAIMRGALANHQAGRPAPAAELLAVHCDHLGCGLPADLCEVDHSTEWHRHGRTDQDNAGVECGSHNRLRHRRRWRTRRDIHGRTHTIRADGTIMLPVGARPPVFPDEPADEPADEVAEAVRLARERVHRLRCSA